MKQLLKISEFARLSGIKRKNLIYYDEIGLLSPERVMDNGYRFYSYRQLDTVSVISSLQDIGMQLSEIKRYLDERTPAALLGLFAAQRKNVEEKIYRLQQIQTMIDTRLDITHRALAINTAEIELRDCAEELLFAGEEVVGQSEEELENALMEFYDCCEYERIIYGYPFGTMISSQNLLTGKWHTPSHFFFKIPMEETKKPRFVKPAGLYLIGFEEAAYEGPEVVYGRMFDYIKVHGLRITGNSYEEYLLDEIAVKNPGKYLLQVSIQVSKNR